MVPPASAARDRTGAPGAWHPLVLVPLAVSAWVYFPITRVYFFADDFVHLASIASDRAAVFLLSPFAGHNYLVRNLIFYLSYHVLGLRADLYFWGVLITHLLNVALLFGLVRLLTGSATLACFGAVLWGTSPLQEGTLGWYTAYGHVLATTVMLLVLLSIARLAVIGTTPRTRTAWIWFALLLLGTTLYGVGIGIALAFPIILFLLLPAAWNQPGPRAIALAVPVVTLAMYFGLRWVGAHIETLPFEELMHEALAHSGFGTIPPMFGHLLAFVTAGTTLSFFLGTYPDVRSLVAAAALAGGFALALWRGGGFARRVMLAMLVLTASTYLLIAVGRAHIYQVLGIPPGQAASVDRYHYAGSLPVAVVVCLVLQQVGRLGPLRRVPPGLALAAGLGVLAVGYTRSGMRIDQHYACRMYFARTMQEIRDAVASYPEGSTVYLENLSSPRLLLGPVMPDRLFPGRAGVFVITHPSDMVDGRRVRFIEHDPEVLAWYLDRPGTRLAQLLVNSEDVTRHP
jgi:hypothetical protein